MLTGLTTPKKIALVLPFQKCTEVPWSDLQLPSSSVLLYVHRKRDAFSASLYLCSHQGSALSLPNYVTYPLCFLSAYKITSRPSVIA